MAILLKGEDERPQCIEFSLGGAEQTGGNGDSSQSLETFFSPKLVICRSAGVGILILSVRLAQDRAVENNYTIDNLINLNYALFKTYPGNSSQNQPIYLKTQTDVFRLKQTVAIAGQPRLVRQLEAQQRVLPDKLALIDDALQRTSAVSISASDGTVDELAASWSMSELTERLTCEFRNKIMRFNSFRLHVFTYLQMDHDDSSKELFDNYIRIIKIQNHNYQVLTRTASGNPLYRQTFRNIFIGSSLEGGGIMTLLPKADVAGADSSFIRNFHADALSSCYLWIYTMVLIQRHSLLNMEHQLTEYDFISENTADKRARLRSMISRMTANKLYAHFADISDHTQHNDFYALCRRNLQIAELYDNVDRKLSSLKEYLEMLTNEETEDIAESRAAVGMYITIAAVVLALFSASLDAFGLLDEMHLHLYSQTTPVWLRNCLVFGTIACVTVVVWVVMAFCFKKRSRDNK